MGSSTGRQRTNMRRGGSSPILWHRHKHQVNEREGLEHGSALYGFIGNHRDEDCSGIAMMKSRDCPQRSVGEPSYIRRSNQINGLGDFGGTANAPLLQCALRPEALNLSANESIRRFRCRGETLCIGDPHEVLCCRHSLRLRV